MHAIDPPRAPYNPPLLLPYLAWAWARSIGGGCKELSAIAPLALMCLALVHHLRCYYGFYVSRDLLL